MSLSVGGPLPAVKPSWVGLQKGRFVERAGTSERYAVVRPSSGTVSRHYPDERHRDLWPASRSPPTAVASAAELAVAVVVTLAVLLVANRAQAYLGGRIEERRDLTTWDDRLAELPDDPAWSRRPANEADSGSSTSESDSEDATSEVDSGGAGSDEGGGQ